VSTIGTTKRTFVFWTFGIMFFLLLYIFFSGPIERNDIYAKCSKGDTISFEIFKKVDRIMKTDKWYFVFFDLYRGENCMYAPHLIVLDHNFILKGASGMIPKCSEITAAKGDTLFGITSDEYKINRQRSRYKCPYRDDLPKNIRFVLKDCDFTRFKRDCRAIIDSIRISNDAENVKLYLRISENVSFPDRKTYLEGIDFYSKSFNLTKELEVPVSSLFFDKTSVNLCDHIIEDGVPTMSWYEMYTLDDKVIDDFFCDYWNKIKEGIH